MKLYAYQQEASQHLAKIISASGAALDASDTGTGKTYTALGMVKAMGVEPLIVCPKSVRTPWRETARALGVGVLDVLNIEKLKTGKTPYLKIVSAKKAKNKKFVWTLPRGTLLIYDEVQSASGYKSQNGKILGLCKAYGIQVLMLSATAAENPLKLRAIGYLLGLHQWKNHYSWCRSHGCYENSWGGIEFVVGSSRLHYLKKIHKEIFPEHGCRVRIEDLDVFPDNSIFAEAYDLDQRSTDEINEIYEGMDQDILNPDSDELPITLRLRARQKTELLKAPLLSEMTVDLLDEGKSIVIFVNFKATLYSIANSLGGQGIDVAMIEGGQSEAQRDGEIDKFQTGQVRVCLVMIQAGGVGVSLHDLTGDHPRVSLISPPDSAVQIKQAFGRIHRAGGKSKCIQRIVFAAGTVEEKSCKSVKRKLDNVSMINDGDLIPDFLEELGDE